MVLEWLRRRDPALQSALRRHLFSEGSIVDREKETEAAETSTGDGSLGIGSLRSDR